MVAKNTENIEWIDGLSMALAHPKTFKIPPAELLATIKPGSTVKVGVQPERFWVIVTKVIDSKISGVVDNDLIYTHIHGLDFDDNVEFEMRNVLDILEQE